MSGLYTIDSDSLTVLDANTLVSGVIAPTGTAGRIIAALLDGQFRSISSRQLINEVLDVLSRDNIRTRFAYSRTLAARLHAELERGQVELLDLRALPVHSRDHKDDHVLACALAGGAHYIVTGDNDLLDLDGHPALRSLHILKPRAFLDLLEQAPTT